MNRLRVRVELNRRKTGVPLDELVSVVEETRKFFHLLAEDVQIPMNRGEWQASNFDPESLNFTAEFSGGASAEQIRAFGSAFGGATSLRRETIAQFAHIVDSIGEDELVGFGLYRSDQDSEPSEWRCLSRRDASRFADEVRLLAKAAGDSGAGTPLPAVMNGSVGGRRLFKDRREREALATDPTKWIRDVESSLSKRISLLEGEVEAHAHKMQSLGNTQEAADERFLRLLAAMESFWSQVPRQEALIGGAREHGLASLGSPAIEKHLVETASIPTQPRKSWRWGRLGSALTAGLILTAVGTSKIGGEWSRLSRSGDRRMTTLESTSPIQHPVDPPKPQPLKAALEPSGPEANNPRLSARQQKTVSPGSASTRPENSLQTQIRRAPSESAAGSPRHDTDVEMIHQISLEVPTDLRAMIREQVLINVMVDFDETGRVTNAEVASTRGTDASLLTTEALKAARWFRFRPSRKGKKTLLGQTVLTFVFDPQTEALVPERLTLGN